LPLGSWIVIDASDTDEDSVGTFVDWASEKALPLAAMGPGAPSAVPAGSWIVGPLSAIGPNGQNHGDAIQFSFMPATCRSLSPGHWVPCMAAHGFHSQVIYQPATRFWAFQGIEAGTFVVLAAVLLAITFWVLKRRDA